EVEEDRLLELDLLVGDGDELVLHRAAVGRVGVLVGALVVLVEQLVAVVVGIGAAVRVLEAVLVLRIVGALVDVVGYAVAVVVRIGAAVRVLEPVLVLGLGRAGVLVVGDAVPVGVLARDDRLRQALVGRRLADRLLRVRVGDVELLARAVVIALAQL